MKKVAWLKIRRHRLSTSHEGKVMTKSSEPQILKTSTMNKVKSKSTTKFSKLALPRPDTEEQVKSARRWAGKIMYPAVKTVEGFKKATNLVIFGLPEDGCQKMVTMRGQNNIRLSGVTATSSKGAAANTGDATPPIRRKARLRKSEQSRRS